MRGPVLKLPRKSMRFLRDERASLAVFFALALIPLVMLLGVAIDYARAATARTNMQAALDAAALILAQEAPKLTPAQITSNGTAYFNKEFRDSQVTSISVTSTYVKTPNTTLTMSVSGQYKTAFVGMLGKSYMPISTSTTAAWGNTKLRVSLVLDNTGSMADNSKMVYLKTAATNLLTQLKGLATNDGDVYVSIIPFAKDVNVKLATDTYKAAWLGWDDWDQANYTKTWGWNCSGWFCYPVQVNTPNAHSTWTGCVTDRDQAYDVSSADPVATTSSTLFPTEQYSACPQVVTPLSYDWTGLVAAIGTMTSNGNTNQTIGLQWGMQSLIATSPLTVPVEDTKYTYNHVIVLFTDGLNTQNRWSSNQATIDARTAAACTAAKNAGIILYTVQVDISSDGESSMLKTCATSTNKYFHLTSAVATVTTFNQIGVELSALRLAK